MRQKIQESNLQDELQIKYKFFPLRDFQPTKMSDGTVQYIGSTVLSDNCSLKGKEILSQISRILG